ncbi:MAG: formylglycine-generating enzyme family protein [Desulfovibrio sp.]|jgi:formylglycine-generating enzyme required for sulfatase activity|nr:formylglycine-generating enzyme family protein [Desulfovibrio sp.]
MRFVVLCLSFLCLSLSNGTPAAQAAEKTCTNSIGMEFILIPAGSFTMGAKDFEKVPIGETPQHRVSISKPFYLGKYEVTQAQWTAVMGNNPSEYKGWSNPVEQVSWDDIQVFIQRLNQNEGHTRYRLPTEAEWEYAARAGTESIYSFGDDARELGNYAWYDEDYLSSSTHPVGQKQPNAWGLYDMHGNVFEWVQDWHGKQYYSNSPGADPKGPSSGSFRVLRGGSWHHPAHSCSSTSRYCYVPDSSVEFFGFRLALSPE